MASPFISREDLSDYIGQDVTSSDKALIAVDSACDTVRTIAEQNFNRGTTTIVMDGTGTDALLLPQMPVNAAGTVIENGGTLTLGTHYKLNGNGILLRGGSITAEECPRSYWWPGRQNVEVTYDHGYDPDDIPRDVRMVALSIAARTYQRSSGVSFEQLGQYSVRYESGAIEATEGEKAILRKYKRTP